MLTALRLYAVDPYEAPNAPMPDKGKEVKTFPPEQIRGRDSKTQPESNREATSKPVARVVRDSLHILDMAVVDNHIWLVTAQGSILHSSNHGLNWESQTPAVLRQSPGKPPRLQQVVFQDTARGFIAGNQGIFLHTEDGGRQWAMRDGRKVREDFRVLLVLDSTRGIGLIDAQGVISYIKNDGEGMYTYPLMRFAVSPSVNRGGNGAPGLGFLVGEGGQVASWNVQDWPKRLGNVPGNPDLHAVRFIDSSAGFVGGERGILARTRDGGNTWDTLSFPSNGRVLFLDFLDKRQGFAVGEKGLLFETRDGGLTWLKASRNPDQADIGSYLRFPPPGYFVLLLLVLALVWPVVRSPRMEVVQESIADQLVSDRPLEDDRFDVLGLCRKADALAAFLSNPRTEPPLTFGIMGEWGRGKSSLMNLLRNRLGRDGFTTVWFNAWHHQSEESLLASLLETIRRTRIAPWWTLDGMRFRLRLSFKRVLHGREGDWLLLLSSLVAFLVLCRWNPLGFEWSLGALDAYFKGAEGKGWLSRLTDGGALLVTMLPLGVTLLSFWRIARKALVVFHAQPSRLLADLAGKATLRDMSEKVGFREEFRREFSEVAEALRHAPLVVFIDDLDRCRPGKVMEILESINFLVTCGPCYFVVAMDKRQITRAIIVNDEKVIELFQDRGEAHAQEYLEKIINIEVQVPEPGPESYRRLMIMQDMPWKAGGPSGDRRWQEALKNLPIYLVIGFLLYLSGALLRAPASLDQAAGGVADSSRAGAGTDSAAFPSVEAFSGEGLEAALPFAWDPAGPPVFRSGTQAPWTRPFAVAIPALFGALMAWAALAWYFQRRRRFFRDSNDFLQAVDEWHPLIFLAAKTPRAVKKFLNRLRFFAVLKRKSILSEGETILADADLVALASIELGVRNLWEEQAISLENLKKFAIFINDKHPGTPLPDRIQTLVNREHIQSMLDEFGNLGANVRVNA